MYSTFAWSTCSSGYLQVLCITTRSLLPQKYCINYLHALSLQLPLKIDIIKHPSEVDGKSTSAHAKVLAPDDVNIYAYPCIPDYPRDGSVR